MMDNHETLIGEAPSRLSHLLTEVLVGLSQRQKSLPTKLLYDKRGSEIFEKICELDEYYPTRAEKEILSDHGTEIASLMGENALIVEPGSGSGEKFRLLMRFLKSPAGYVPVEISREILLRMTGELCEEFPFLDVFPVPADFTTEVKLPVRPPVFAKTVVFFPGSTIGNFNPPEAVEFLRHYMKIAGPGSGLLIGADLKKDPDLLLKAYDDSNGVTAAFNLNLLRRLNRELDAAFDLNHFFHRAVYNHGQGRVEMHLVSKISQLVRVNQTVFRFSEGESIHTENSYKYSVEDFTELLSQARLSLRKNWQDKKGQFSVYYFERG